MKRHGEMIGVPLQVNRTTAHRIAGSLIQRSLCAAFLALAVFPCAHPVAYGLVASATRAPADGLERFDVEDQELRTAFWPFTPARHPPLYESNPCNVTPHPAVARIIVPEQGVTAYGSG